MFHHNRNSIELQEMRTITFIACFLVWATSCTSLPIDPSVKAADANARTLILGGCGVKANSKYLYCEENEGNSTNESVNIFVPTTDCPRDSCSRYQFFRKNGSNGPAGSIPKDTGSASVSLSSILGHDGNISSPDDGEYGVLVQTFYIGPDGKEYSILAKGLVRVSVVGASYRPLACGDPNTAWSTDINNKCNAQFSTAYRSALCGSGCQ
jgi:hypothetical protein